MEMIDEDYTVEGQFNAFDTTIDVIFIETKSISDCQKKNHETFIAKQNELAPAILKAIFDYYKDAYQDYKQGIESFSEFHPDKKMSEKEVEKIVPTPTTPENLKKHITPLSIYIQSSKNCVDGTVGIAFTCTWDEKSELGVRISNWKDIQVGMQDIAFLR